MLTMIASFNAMPKAFAHGLRRNARKGYKKSGRYAGQAFILWTCLISTFY
ncbi:hypothetical protein ES708_20147 [subsurface metagenome]